MQNTFTQKRLAIVLVGCILLSSCKKDEDISATAIDTQLMEQLNDVAPGGDYHFFQQPKSNDFNRIPQDPRNDVNGDKVSLGQALYHETQLAIHPKYAEAKYTYSCASCHHAAAGFQAGLRQGISDGGWGFGFAGEARIPHPNYSLDSLDVQPIRTPSTLNSAYQDVMLWNGQFGATGTNAGTEVFWTAGTPKEENSFGYQGVEIQAIAGLKVHRMGIGPEITTNAEYQEMFEKAFPKSSGDELYSRENAGLAIAAYERTLLPNQAPFQSWLGGDFRAMTEQQKEGALLFFGKAKCVSCHTGPALNRMEFHALGMPDLIGNGIYGSGEDKSEHLGRGGFTGNPGDNYKFKIPQLYNLKDSPFFGHGGTFTSVREVIEYKNQAISSEPIDPNQLSEQFRPLDLTEHEITALVAFIEEALYDDDLVRYTPNSLPSGACFPNADPRSREDLHCR